MDLDTMPTGKIRAIDVGGLKNDGFRYSVGQEKNINGRSYTIVRIVCDKNAYTLSGVLRYLIYIQETGNFETEERCWKWYENMPIGAECEID